MALKRSNTSIQWTHLNNDFVDIISNQGGGLVVRRVLVVVHQLDAAGTNRMGRKSW
jgi:hypothetical protein